MVSQIAGLIAGLCIWLQTSEILPSAEGDGGTLTSALIPGEVLRSSMQGLADSSNSCSSTGLCMVCRVAVSLTSVM